MSTDVVTGVTRTFHDENPSLIQEEIFLCTNKTEGTHRKYDDNGNLTLYSNYVNGLLEGEYREYINTILTVECTYIHGKIHGEHHEYYESGYLQNKVDYVNGLKHGHMLRYHANGELYMSCYYRNDKLEGSCYTYDHQGALYKEMHYINGEADGECKIYYMYGLAESIPYSNGVIDGVLQKFDEFGNQTKITYCNGHSLTVAQYNKEGECISHTFNMSRRLFIGTAALFGGVVAIASIAVKHLVMSVF